jgi:hypothetical protein
MQSLNDFLSTGKILALRINQSAVMARVRITDTLGLIYRRLYQVVKDWFLALLP